MFPIALLIAGITVSSHASAMDPGSHAMAGGAMGLRWTRTPAQAFLVGLASHALLDMIPHSNPPLKSPGTAAYLAADGALLYNAWNHNDRDPRIFWGAAGGVLPDADYLLPHHYFPTHNGRLKHGKHLSRTLGRILIFAVNGVAYSAMF
jgi:hypothetical protein